MKHINLLNYRPHSFKVKLLIRRETLIQRMARMVLLNSECLGVCKHSSNDLTTVPECVKFELRLESDLSTRTHR